ncbi:accessory Sec system translocase SecA2 [Streptococcus ratti]|uniref:Protein translocase subunit SecA n=2 Tax=Streptococcus ratti TaxID=1341 RepID=A0ABN0GTS3_STRRT|nr:accessory Sec system translocase SecA2 [Streptococcus ratti]EJN93703.1 preprotein translocase subunit SecA [Streptococcus ratti FA-1 = DSM 20564]QEY07560.1 accessory Sec system translocase SecA2 [Streptococcus ratti]VEI60015.1 Protein export cytoplasm protein SecA2 ATPase RNA helicase (TC 3.A.5.1.1) [Streptococcus mutans]
MGNLKTFFSLDYFRLKKVRKILKKINSYAAEMATLSASALQAKTSEFRERIEQGQETLEDILPEAFAVVREADKRLLGLYPYDVQVMGAIVLHYGNIAEMRTGEGKTLTATMPLYLNALSGQSAMLITTNEYLAIRDATELKKVYEFLGLTIGVGVRNDEKKMTVTQKRQVYQSDIIYTTSSALGFDYLIDNLADSPNKKFLSPFNYVIIDEADAVLLDTAQTPLIISGAPRVQSNLYRAADNFITTLLADEDFHYDKEKKEVWLTQKGIDEAERFFSVKNLYHPDHFELVRHLTLALRAQKLYKLGKDYIIDNNKIKLVDQKNGRILEGTKLQSGQHQAIEAKEQLKITQELRAMASITYPNLFLMFKKISGMTGTGKPDEAEFIDVYNMEVIRIPTNKPVIRKDYPDLIYTTLPEKVAASIAQVKKIHKTGQPILLITGSVRMSELYSEILLLEAIPHNLLNAHSAVKEAQMIAEAGRLGSVTVATNMAGRGTDIKLSDEVKKLGGLAVIGIERMVSERMDLQARGRSGRQGDPGFSQFFVSLEDDLLVEYGSAWLLDYFKKYKDTVDESRPQPLKAGKFKRAVRNAQSASASNGRSARNMTLSFDESVKIQRNKVYSMRNQLLSEKEFIFDAQSVIEGAIEDFIASHPNMDSFVLERYIFDHISYSFAGIDSDFDLQDKKAVKQLLLDLAMGELQRKKELIHQQFDDFQRVAVLRAIDESWIEEVDYLQQLRIVVSGRSSAQRNPIYEYHREALLSYKDMKKEIQKMTLHYLMLSEVSYTPNGDLSVYFI